MEAAISPTDKPERQRSLYGRRVGRGMTAYQGALLKTTLPELKLDLQQPAPQPLGQLFRAGVADIWLEIGFGGGEHLAWQAENHPGIGIIGCEPFMKGIASLLSRIQDSGLSNVRVHDDDARFVLDWLPNASIGRTFVLFPDPWPKKRHRKRRLLSAEVLGTLARIMRPGAEFRFATDIPDYEDMVGDALALRRDFAAKPGLLAARPADWPATRYEEKAIAAGRSCRFYCFERA